MKVLEEIIKLREDFDVYEKTLADFIFPKKKTQRIFNGFRDLARNKSTLLGCNIFNQNLTIL